MKAQQLVEQHGQGQPCGVNLLACRRALVATVDALVTLVASAAVGSLPKYQKDMELLE